MAVEVPDMDERMCRICLDAGDEPLIAPCSCRGTSWYAHFSCVQSMYEAHGDWSNLECPTCKLLYKDAVAVKLGLIGLHRAEAEYGSTHPVVSSTLCSLGEAYYLSGDASESCKLLEQGLAIAERRLGPDHPDVGLTLLLLGQSYCHLDPARSRQVLERALSINEQRFAVAPKRVASNLRCLGDTYAALGDRGRSRQLFEQALAIVEEQFGPDHDFIACFLKSLADSISWRDPVRSVKLLERALAIDEQKYGPSHPEIVPILRSLGNSYLILGGARKIQACQVLERALALEEFETLPLHYPDIAYTLSCLGEAYLEVDDAAAARKVLERALALDEAKFGPAHEEVGKHLYDLACAHYSLGDAPRSRELLERALAIKFGAQAAKDAGEKVAKEAEAKMKAEEAAAKGLDPQTAAARLLFGKGYPADEQPVRWYWDVVFEFETPREKALSQAQTDALELEIGVAGSAPIMPFARTEAVAVRAVNAFRLENALIDQATPLNTATVTSSTSAGVSVATTQPVTQISSAAIEAMAVAPLASAGLSAGTYSGERILTREEMIQSGRLIQAPPPTWSVPLVIASSLVQPPAPSMIATPTPVLETALVAQRQHS